MKETVNSWILRNEDRTKHTIRCREKTGDLKYDKSRFHVYVCGECNRVYEQNPFLNEGAKIYFYGDFPTYRLERKECTYCKRGKK